MWRGLGRDFVANSSVVHVKCDPLTMAVWDRDRDRVY